MGSIEHETKHKFIIMRVTLTTLKEVGSK